MCGKEERTGAGVKVEMTLVGTTSRTGNVCIRNFRDISWSIRNREKGDLLSGALPIMKILDKGCSVFPR